MKVCIVYVSSVSYRSLIFGHVFRVDGLVCTFLSQSIIVSIVRSKALLGRIRIGVIGLLIGLCVFVPRVNPTVSHYIVYVR
jgi:hypothetical protein